PEKPSSSAAWPADGWRHAVDVAAVKLPTGETAIAGARLRLWVEQGWLIASRERPAGDLEWQVVLARAAGAAPPQTRVDPLMNNYELRYGPYFVRETGGRLRLFRERKAADSPPWPEPAFDPQRRPLGSAGAGAPFLTGFVAGDWSWAVGGPKDRADVWVRMQHKDLGGPGNGFSNLGGTVMGMFYGDR